LVYWFTIKYTRILKDGGNLVTGVCYKEAKNFEGDYFGFKEGEAIPPVWCSPAKILQIEIYYNAMYTSLYQ